MCRKPDPDRGAVSGHDQGVQVRHVLVGVPDLLLRNLANLGELVQGPLEPALEDLGDRDGFGNGAALGLDGQDAV